MIIPFALDVPPLTPDADQARGWAEHELANPAYAAARPTPLDRVARAVQQFFIDLLGGQPEGSWGVWLAVAVAALLVVLIVLVVVFTGRPRLARRTGVRRELFGDVEMRTAAQLRRAAAAAAASEDWPQAIILRQRALARGLVEREAIQLPPGATVHAFARAAGALFADLQPGLDGAAAAFDDVRYLRGRGTAAQYATVAEVDDAVRARAVAASDATRADATRADTADAAVAGGRG